ncbi:MAG: dihydrolipoamide acetyltransferase family protein [Acidimicrobiales bacterium]
MADTAKAHDITMPQLGETVTEGTITRWFKQVGERIAEDEPLFEVSTDKVDSEVPSSVTGYVTEILVPEGETVDVGVRLAVVTEGAPTGDAPPAGAATAPSGDAEGGYTTLNDPGTTGTRPDPDAAASGRGNGASGPATEPRRARLLSPLVRRLLAEHNLDPSAIPGTGVDGRITRADVMTHIEVAPARAKAAPQVAPSRATATKPTETAAPRPRPRTGDEVVPFSNIRRRTAEHMVRSQATSAHVLVATEVDYSGVDRLRAAEREQFKADEGFSLTYLPFVARAAIDAIADFPQLNASVGDDQLIVHHFVHLGIAVDLNFDGLIVPVIHDADSKRLRPLAREVADLAARARSRKLNADEISGSTFTITNPGSFGTFITAPVINQPQVAILSLDGVRKRPVVVELPDGTDAVAIHPVGMLALSFDHRAFDGAYASAFLARCRQILETRDWGQEL